MKIYQFKTDMGQMHEKTLSFLDYDQAVEAFDKYIDERHVQKNYRVEFDLDVNPQTPSGRKVDGLNVVRLAGIWFESADSEKRGKGPLGSLFSNKPLMYEYMVEVEVEAPKAKTPSSRYFVDRHFTMFYPPKDKWVWFSSFDRGKAAFDRKVELYRARGHTVVVDESVTLENPYEDEDRRMKLNLSVCRAKVSKRRANGEVYQELVIDLYMRMHDDNDADLLEGGHVW